MTDNPFSSKPPSPGGSAPINAEGSRFDPDVSKRTAINGPDGDATTHAGEVLSATDKASLIKSQQKENSNQTQLDSMSGLMSLDWRNIEPPVLAQILSKMPFKGSGTDPDYYLQPFQALIFSMRCYELKLSPFSNEVWFNPKNNKTNVTFEGKLKLARQQGFKLGPPQFERVTTKKTIAGKNIEDWGYKCSMNTPSGTAEYTAWFTEWNVSRSPVWKEKPDHMLQLRAAEKCLSFASGIGASELMGDRDLEVGPTAAEVMPDIDATEFKEVKQK